jgi:GAF domain-containing protein
MVTKADYAAVVERLKQSQSRGRELRREAMLLLNQLSSYSWSGVYVLDGDTLELDEFVGAPTEHTRIPVGRGVCGTAVAEARNQIIDDVNSLDNYLSCSTDTRSEIVVLIKRGEKIVGQIDVDGHATGAFDLSDEEMLDDVAEILASRWD